MTVSRSYVRHLVKSFYIFFLYLKKTQLIWLVICSIIFLDIHPFICSVIYPVIRYVIDLNIHQIICLVIHPVICPVIWCFPVWQSSFIKLSNGSLQCKFIRTFYPDICDLTPRIMQVVFLCTIDRAKIFRVIRSIFKNHT